MRNVLSSEFCETGGKRFAHSAKRIEKQIRIAHFYPQRHCLSRVSADITATLPRHDAGDGVTPD